MKQALFSLCFLIAINATTAQNNILRGIISIKGEDRKPLKGVSVEAVGVGNKFITGDNGVYEIKCNGMTTGEDVTLLVNKEGYVVLNKDALQAVTIKKSPTQLFNIVMQEEGKQKSDIAKAEKSIKDNANQNYQKLEAEFTALRATLDGKLQQPSLNDIERKGYQDSIQRINTRLNQAAMERDAALSLAQQTAEQLTAFDTEGASKESKRAQALFEAGKLDSAYNSMNEETIRRKADAAKRLQAKSDSLRDSAIKDYFYKAKLAIANGKFADAERLYTEGVRLNEKDVDNLWTLAYFLADQNKKHEATAYYEKALALAETPALKATFQNNLGNLYSANQKMPQAEAAFTEALKIIRQLADKNPDAFLPDVAMTLNNLGTYYYANQKMPQAEAAFTEALKTYRQLADESPDAFLPDVAMTLNNLGAYYHDNQKTPQAEAAYNEALKIRRQLADKNPDAFLPDVATTLNNIGVFYSVNQKTLQAEAAYDEALKIRRQLADKNPDAFLPDVAMTLNNLGAYYYANQKMPQAEAAYNEALKIRRQLADKNPDAFLPDVATTLNNLGAFYRANQKMPQAEAAYNEALKIRRQLADKNPDAFLPDVAMTLYNLGNYYFTNQKTPQAEAAYNEALKIRRQLANKNPDAFLPDVATTLNNLGVFYKTLKNYDTALIHYSEAMQIREAAILRGGIHQFNDWVKVLGNVSAVKDSAQAKKDYRYIVKAGQLLAKGCDTLKGINDKLKPIAVSQYGSLSWNALFVKDYGLSEKAALRCLELDATQIYVFTNLGHSQLLRGQYAAAKKTYQQLKGKKDGDGTDYKAVILKDLADLEAEGITHQDVARMKAEIEQW